MKKKTTWMYVSSWNEHGGAPGLGRYRINPDTGEFWFEEMIDTRYSFNMSLLDVSRGKLYINNEVPGFDGYPNASGRIFLYDLDPDSGRLKEAGYRVTDCPNPAFLAMDPTGSWLLEAHHSCDAAVALHRRGKDGRLRTTSFYAEADLQVYRLNSEGVPVELTENLDLSRLEKGKKRKESHPHSAVFSPSGKLIAVADKGTGYLNLFTLDRETGRLTLRNRQLTDCPGASPRYVVFHPEKPFLFVNHEASYDGNCYISAFRYDEDGSLERVCVVNVLERPYSLRPDIRLEQQGFVISPSGNFLYTQINSADVLAAVKIDQETGGLQVLQNLKIPGIWPRGLALFPGGKYIWSSCLVSGELTTYRIEEDGTLTVVCRGPKQPGASWASFYTPEGQ